VELRSSDVSYQSSDSKALPDRPNEEDPKESERLSIVTDDDEEAQGEAAKVVSFGHDSGYGSVQQHVSTGQAPFIPPRRQSLHSTPFRVEGREIKSLNPIQPQEQLPVRTHEALERIPEPSRHLDPPIYHEYMPAPLSPRRPLSPVPAPKEVVPNDEANESDSARHDNDQHTSWLNTINESSGSSASSVQSRRSSIDLRRKRIRAASGNTEAEFDAALDAAIETAYDDGFEPDDEGEDDVERNHEFGLGDADALASVRRNIEQTKENILEAEREAVIARAKENERKRLQNTMVAEDSLDAEYGDEEADEEERMLEEMTRGYILDDMEYDLQTKSALPRQSDSSGFSGRTWGSSTGSNPASAGTSLSTVAEASVMPSMASQLKENPLPPPVHPPPSTALPPPPVPPAPTTTSQPTSAPARPPPLTVRSSSPGVRDRRLSGMKAKQLTIETKTKLSSSPENEAPKTQPTAIPPPMVPQRAVPEPPKSAFITPDALQTLPNSTYKAVPSSATLPSSRQGSFPFAGSEPAEPSSALTKVTSADSDMSIPSLPPSPAPFATKATGLRKHFSSSSLRSKGINAETQETSPNTSVSSMSSVPRHHILPSPRVPVLPTPVDANLGPKVQPMGGIYLFDCDIHSYSSPGSPNPSASITPLPLEPCPDSALLRPFWFLRCIYQTVANQRGGYITTRLFIPRDIWRVKNIKLKNVEEKISSCDLLTAALLKLGKVDTFNADAVLEEMQFLESVMDQVQTNLSKKLGSDVGVQGAASTFKGMSTVDDSASNSEALTSKSNNTSNKSYLSSWRKLRSKNSVGPGLTSASNKDLSKDGAKEAPTMKSLPMTAHQNPRFAKRDVTQVQCMGPNPSYMGALARLCDAAQVLGKLGSDLRHLAATNSNTDQIARQVEDPGLKHSSQTHVGLELSARHAAEFFGFYVCRFVLADIGIMMDKFIKRGTEWVLA